MPAVRGVAVLLACLVLAGWLLWAAALRPAVSVVHAAVWPGDHQQSCSIITRVSDNDQLCKWRALGKLRRQHPLAGYGRGDGRP